MLFSKLKILIIGFGLVLMILGNFWYYIHQSTETNPKTRTLPTLSITPPKVMVQPKMVNAPVISDPQPDTLQIAPTSSEVGTKEESAVSSQETMSPIIKKKNVPKTPVTAVNDTTKSPRPIVIDSAPGESPKSDDKTNYSAIEKILIDKSWNGNGNNSNYSHYWGNENISFSADTLKVFYPKGSNAPSNAPRGGAGFVYAFPQSYNRLSMSYTIRFEEGFDFVKGGKLPGLCGGNCSRGGSMPTASGFSIRFVWKKNGYLDIMTFFPNTTKAGNFSGEKMFKMEPGKEYLITQQITLNDIGKENGIINILVNGVSVYKKDNVTIRISPDVQINSFLFSTFFGGKDTTYSSSKDTYIYFGKFKISEVF